MLEKIQKLLPIADFLKDDAQKTALLNLQHIVERGCFHLAFLGQFSAGKSRLINSLLGRELLPVKTTESTSAVTFISYGKEESVVFSHNDGTRETQNFDALKSFAYRGEGWSGRPIDSDDIEYIEVHIDNPLLSTGLILVDTPGVNTINLRHEQLTAHAIDSSGYAVYVLGGAMAKSDQLFIRQLAEQGLKFIFVRTKMDLIQSIEENPVLSIEQEKSVIKELLGTEPVLFPVSNEAGNEWFKQITAFRDCLSTALVADVSGNLKKASENRLALIVERLGQKLSQYQEIAMTAVLQEHTVLDEKILALEQQKTMIAERLEQKQKKLAKDVSVQLDYAHAEATELTQAACRQYRKNLSAITARTEQNVLKQQLMENINRFGFSLRSFLKDELDNILRKAGTSINEEALAFDGNLDLEDVVFENYDDYIGQLPFEGDTVESAESGDRIQQCENLIKQMDAKYTDLKAEHGQQAMITQEAHKKLQEFLTQDFDLYKLEEPTGPSNSDKMATLGKFADIALLLLPGAGVGKALGLGEKAIKAMQYADTAKDLLYGGKILTNTFPGSQKQLPDKTDSANQTLPVVSGSNTAKSPRSGISGILDMLTLENLFRTIGKSFDAPPNYVLDANLANQVAAKQYALEQKYAKMVQAEIEKKQALGLIKTKKEEVEARLNAEKRMEAEREQEKKREKREFLEKSEQDYCEKLRAKYADSFDSRACTLSKLLLTQFNAEAQTIPSILLPYYTDCLKEKIVRYDEQLRQLAQDRQTGEAAIKQCTEYAKQLAALGAN